METRVWADWLFWLGLSRTSIQAPPWFRSMEWTPKRRWHGTLESAWRTSTRPRWRRMGATTAAFGARFPGLMVTVASFVLSSLPICHPNPWYCVILKMLVCYMCSSFLSMPFLIVFFFFWCFLCRVLVLGYSCIPAIYKVLFPWVLLCFDF